MLSEGEKEKDRRIEILILHRWDDNDYGQEAYVGGITNKID